MRVDSDGYQSFSNQLSSWLPDKDQIQRVAFHSLRLVAAAAIAARTYQQVMNSHRGRLELLPWVALIQALKFTCLSDRELQPSFAVQVIRCNQALLSGVAFGAASASLVIGAQHLEEAQLDGKIVSISAAIFDIAWAIGDPGASSWHLFSKSLASDDELLKDLRAPPIYLSTIAGKILFSFPNFFSCILVQPLEGAKPKEPVSLLSRIDRVVDFSLFVFSSGLELYFSPKPVLGGLVIETLSLCMKNSNESQDSDQTIEPDLKFFSGSFEKCMRSIATKFFPIATTDQLDFFGGFSAGWHMPSKLMEYWNRGLF